MALLSDLLKLRKSTVVKSIGIYTFSNFFSKGISFLLIPLFTNPAFLTPEDNGLLSLFNSTTLFLMPFVSLGLIQSTSTDFFKLDKKEFKDFFSTGFVLPVIVTLLSIAVMFLLKNTLTLKYGFPGNFFWIIPAITFFTFCNEQLLSLVRNNNQPIHYFYIGMFRIVVELGLAIVLIVFLNYHWYGRISGILVSYVLLSGYTYHYFTKNGYLFGTIKKQYLRSEIIYALPIVVLQGSVFVMSSSDKFFLANDHAVVGIYAVACTFASVIIILCTAMLQYVFPQLYTILSQQVVDYATIRKYFYLYCIIMLCGTAAVIVFTPLFYKYFINNKYHHALSYSYLIATGYFFWTISYFFYSFLFYYKQKKKILLLSFLYILMSLTCNYFFIHAYSDTGAAIAICCSYFVALVLTIIFTKQYWQIFLKRDIVIHTVKILNE